MNSRSNDPHSQQGVALLILILTLLISGAAILFSVISGNNTRLERQKETSLALTQAKEALLGYAASINLNHAGCAGNCRRLGDMPCPDMNNDGVAEVSCGNAAGTTGQALRIGRLPWKTLGLGDLRDGNGDRLWYAVSNRFKQNARAFPLNSDTLGTISIKDLNGNIIHDATSTTGAVALVISVGTPITRQDGFIQSRTAANENSAIHYLDNGLGEDNSDFIDASSNGFIKGEIHDSNGEPTLNDQLVVITHSDMMNAIEPVVATEVKSALSIYKAANTVYPSPASYSDSSCLGFASIGAGSCLPDSLISKGRVPVNPVPDWDATSILNGVSNNNWFQQNGWREHIYYATGSLTLNGAKLPGAKELIVIATGSALSTQIRAVTSDRLLESNYMELENLVPLDDIYLRLPMAQHGNSFNDFAVSVP